MLAPRRLAIALETVSLVPFAGHLCRAVRTSTLFGFQNGAPYQPRPLFDLGPPRGGGRYTPRGGAPALYLAEDYETSLREYLQIGRSAALEPMPGHGAITIFTAAVRLEAMLDLTDPVVLAALGTSETELAQPWRYRRRPGSPPTHVLGRAIASTGRIQGIRFRSTKGGGNCFVLLTATIAAPSFVRVSDPEGRLVQSIPAAVTGRGKDAGAFRNDG